MKYRKILTLWGVICEFSNKLGKNGEVIKKKAHSVVLGNHQEGTNIEKNYSPVVNMVSICFIPPSYTVRHKLKVYHIKL